MQRPMPRWRSRSTGRKPSPRFASVVGQAQTRAPAWPSRSSSRPSACVACTTVVRAVRQPVSASSSIGRMPCSATQSSISRGCSSAWTCSGRPSARRVAAELLEPVARARAHGVGGDADANAARPQLLELGGGSPRPTPAGSGRCRRARTRHRAARRSTSASAAASAAALRLRRGRDSGTRRRRCTRRRASRRRPAAYSRRTRPGV